MGETYVVNASPLIFLGNADLLDLLFVESPRAVVVPETVWHEVTVGRGGEDLADRLATYPMLIRQADPEIPDSVAAWDLGRGESAVLAAGLARTESRVANDDLQGRRCALALGIRLRGTLGLVVRAHRCGRVADVRAVIEELRRAGMWLSDKAIASALSITDEGSHT